MARQTSYATEVRYLQKATAGIHVSLFDCSNTTVGSADYGGFEPDHDFGPRAISDEQGNALFSHLPQGVSRRLGIVRDQEGRVSTRTYLREGKKARIIATPPDSWVREVFLIPAKYLSQELAVPLTHSTIASGRVVDAVTGNGIAGVTLNAVKKNLQFDTVTSSHNSVAETGPDGNFLIALSPGEQEIAILSPVVGYQAPSMRNQTVEAEGQGEGSRKP